MSYKRIKLSAKARSMIPTDRFLKLPHNVMNHPNFQLLNGNSLKVLIYICSIHDGFNNGKIAASYAQIESNLHIGRSAIKSALDELQAARFLELKKKGIFTGRKATEWRITFLKADGLPAGNEWGSAPVIKKYRRKSPSKIHESLSQSAKDISDMRMVH